MASLKTLKGRFVSSHVFIDEKGQSSFLIRKGGVPQVPVNKEIFVQITDNSIVNWVEI